MSTESVEAHVPVEPHVPVEAPVPEARWGVALRKHSLRPIANRTGVSLNGDEPHVIITLPDAQSRVTGGLTTATRAQLAAKRRLDVIGSVVLLLILSPLFLFVACLVAVTSSGPILYRQTRVGKGGSPFTMLKFRSMYAGADTQLEDLWSRNEVDGPVFKIHDDPRVTPAGRFLRRYSLDELPQLWNVLRGDMSLVGPRPPLPAEVAQYGMREEQRLRVAPGLTCTWQVSGRSDLAFDRWMEMDLAYISDWTLWLDLRILFRTIPAVVSGRGAC